MSKIAALLVACMMCSVTLSAEVKITKYPNGKIRYKRQYVDGKLDGASSAYYESGKLKTHAIFRDGKLDGMTTGFYENGAVKAEIPMYKGKVDGYQKEFYSNGQMMSISQFQNGINIGAKKIYYSNGNLKAKLYYNDKGRLDGTIIEYYPDGNKRYSIKVEDGLAIKGDIYDSKGDKEKMTVQDFADLGF